MRGESCKKRVEESCGPREEDQENGQRMRERREREESSGPDGVYRVFVGEEAEQDEGRRQTDGQDGWAGGSWGSEKLIRVEFLHPPIQRRGNRVVYSKRSSHGACRLVLLLRRDWRTALQVTVTPSNGVASVVLYGVFTAPKSNVLHVIYSRQWAPGVVARGRRRNAGRENGDAFQRLRQTSRVGRWAWERTH